MSHAPYFIISLLNISQKDIYHLVLVFICFSLSSYFTSAHNEWGENNKQEILLVLLCFALMVVSGEIKDRFSLAKKLF